MSSPVHPAVTINNIKNSIPLILDSQTEHYNTWAELFVLHCKAYDVYDHLQPRESTTSSSSSKDSSDKEKDKAPVTKHTYLES
ncbi:hypothetical protein HanPI659440_Chr16g0621891 [Helianthus annuus]|nr:hypothetical protein HanPI659440_Chr16g0621891 [Helianthus annuus]